MVYCPRLIEQPIQKALSRGKSILMLGPRQTGKTTVLQQQISSDAYINFADPELRIQYEMSPNLLKAEINAIVPNKSRKIPLIILDEIQKVPELMDLIQILIDSKQAQFILTGSSARKLRRHNQAINLLAGRVVMLHLDPLSLLEIPEDKPVMLESLLTYGSLPGIFLQTDNQDKETDLKSYVISYLEEEIRAEALVRNIGAFARFLEQAALELGRPINFEKISQDIGVKRHTIVEYYQILMDCLIIDCIEPITHSDRRRLTKANKYLLFDLGVRRTCVREGGLSKKQLASVFEQFVGMEILRYLRLYSLNGKLQYWRDHNGAEVDYVIEINRKYIPIEVKWTKTPNMHDVTHLQTFQEEYDCYETGYLFCRCAKPLQLTPHILALPWQELPRLVEIFERL